MLCAEGYALAEDVNVVGEFAADSRNHLVADDADVFVGIVPVLGRNDVCGQKRGDDSARPFVRRLLNDLSAWRTWLESSFGEDSRTPRMLERIPPPAAAISS